LIQTPKLVTLVNGGSVAFKNAPNGHVAPLVGPYVVKNDSEIKCEGGCRFENKDMYHFIRKYFGKVLSHCVRDSRKLEKV
jgi:hypothetical protein